MDFIRGLFNKSETPVPLKPPSPLTEKVINDTVSDLITNGTSNPSNQEIAEKLGRTTDEVTAFRQGIKEKLPKSNFNPSFPPRDQKAKWPFPTPPTMNGGRSKTNKNKKKHKKLSRQRRHPDSKKNRKSMKRK